MTTNKDLYRYHLDLEQLGNGILSILLKSRIKDFRQNNQLRINTLVEKIDEMQEKYFVVKDGQVQLEKIEGVEKPIMLEGMLYADFEKEFTELMNKPVNIII